MNIRAATTARRLLQLAAILILTACALPGLQAQPSCLGPAAAATNVDIVIGAGGLPEFDSRIFCLGEDPTINPKNGNICLDINKKPDLRFNLKGPGANAWQFVEIQLSGDGESWPGELPLGAYSDFEFGSDAALQTGKPHAQIAGVNGGKGNQMKVRNNNCHEFEVYYRILLKQPGATDVYYYLHPMMDNRGSNN
jgi:hypothetical protein